MTFVLAFVPFGHYAQALTILVSHGGSGDLELCIESQGYDDQCNNFNLFEYQNPFEYIVDVEDPDQGHNFQICYEIRDTDLEDCRTFEFTGSSEQTINIDIPSTGLSTGSGTANNEGFSLENTEESSPPPSPPDPVEVPSELPPLPPPLP
jgi:hypothetical protein